MQSALPRHGRSSTGRAIAFALAVSALLHVLLLVSSGRLDWASKPSTEQTPQLALQVELAQARPARATKQNTPARTTPPQHPRQAARHVPTAPVSHSVRPQNNTPDSPLISRAPTDKPSKHSASRSLSLPGLLQQAGEIANADTSSLQPSGTLVYGSSAKGVQWTAYKDDWVRKMERVGAMNYPEEVRRQSLTGGPTLSVVINADGSLQAVRTIRGSGSPILDAAASKLVRAAAPFAPFPPSLAQQARSLEIRRKWTFSTDNDLSVH